MKATVIHRFGGPEILEQADVATPDPGPGELLIRVGACGINRYDLDLRKGAVFQDLEFPHVLGADVSGVVAALAADVTGWRVGERVIAAPGYPIDPCDWAIKPENMAPSFEVVGTHQWGGYAEFMRIPARFALKDDTGLSEIDAAAMPLVLMTAVHAVATLGEVKKESRVLVQAGASGSGSACIQAARVLGARVATTVGSGAKVEFAKSCGAEQVIVHTQRNFADDVLDWTDGVGVDVVIDNVGASVLDDNLRCLRRGGIFVNFGLVGGLKATLDMRQLFFRQHQLRGSFMGSLDELRTGLQWLRDRRVRPMVDRTYPTRDAAEAHRYIASRAVKGKVVLVPE